jgi:formylglycine-generating enzyme required for sulfatase activity
MKHGEAAPCRGFANAAVRKPHMNLNPRLLILTLCLACCAVGRDANAQRNLTTNPRPLAPFGSTEQPEPPPQSVPAPAPQAPPPSSGLTAQRAGIPDPGEIFKDCNNCPELVVIPPGDFVMGSNDTPYEKPERTIAIRNPFAIGRREVTFAEWDQCADAGACKVRPDDHGWGRGDRPVINVSWDDAKAFLAWLSQRSGQRYRLPTEAEWEYTARAGTKTPFWWGRDVGAGRAQCDGCASPTNKQTSPVGSFRPNGFGLFDTAGNAAEWVEDCWNDNYRNAPRDASAWMSGDCHMHVLRGGAFTSKATDVRSSARFRYDSDVRYYANGFRVARDLQ